MRMYRRAQFIVYFCCTSSCKVAQLNTVDPGVRLDLDLYVSSDTERHNAQPGKSQVLAKAAIHVMPPHCGMVML